MLLLFPVLAMAAPAGSRIPIQTASSCSTATPASTAAAPSTAIPAAAPRLFVTATGARRAEGNVTFTLYGARPEAFLAHKGKIALSRVTLTGTEATACFAVSSPGSYAMAVYHDQNGNLKFDRTLIGLPAEGYGFSNDAPVHFGPPSFGEARFEVRPGDNHIAIRLRY